MSHGCNYKNWRVKFINGTVIHHICQSLASPKFNAIRTVYAHNVNVGYTGRSLLSHYDHTGIFAFMNTVEQF